MSSKFFAYWVHQLDPFVFRFPSSFFTEGIRWYGVAYLLGLLSAYVFFNMCSRKGRSPLSVPENESFLVAIALGILFGGRTGYVIFYDFAFWKGHPLWIFRFWEGGMSFHGAVIGIAIAIMAFSRRYSLSFLQSTDLCCAIAPLGVFFGRLANFINGELWGKVTTLPWAIRFPQSVAPLTPIAEIPPRHPSQLYEALLEGILLFLLLQRTFWKSPSRTYGKLTADFLCFYSFVRYFAEIFREPDAPTLYQLSRGQVLSLFLALVGIILYAYLEVRDRRRPTNSRDDSAEGA
ncbi:MAG: prolipoprotein diacylglyceryl transferase [Puniceicoccales bacterium]|jgi:phosphatidylglycerol:prolipoprotein diacylglycerol transferase|nr:prolipoprotein diacylglyceryl transferase [Puniceicoccales bacterium]